ncbi:uncharacterized protein LOC105162625 [Sesamum indicum]|uniref:Uncharacterized protein LOC105162625 n=1 Tax=Sesamum indicum TaxID=4182 RepID=A0A6I9T9N5_SESIN|nr:uncharacterized protein LOC105162625 [Sesamum indicum]
MSRIPHELIRQVQISTRTAAGLSDYNPSNPTLPALPSLSAVIAAFDPSPPHLRCENCNGGLLRGSESIICVYCGRGPHYDVVPDPISFSSTIGYQWLLRSLHLDGSEMVNRTNKSEQDQGQSSPKTLTPLSDFLNFKVQWPAETEKEESSLSDKPSEESKGSLSLTGVAPHKFFIKSKRDVLSDMPAEQLFVDNQFENAGRKDIAAPDHQNLFQNFQSSDPADSSSEHKASEMSSRWEADFQSADSVNHHSGYESSKNFAGSSDNSGNKIQDSQSIDCSTDVEGDLAAEIDSVFGPGKDQNDENPKDNPAVTPAFDDLNSQDMWNNLRSNDSRFAGGFDATISSKDAPKDDHALENSKDFSTGVDLFQDFQSQTNYTEMTENKMRNEDREIINDDKQKDNPAVTPAFDVWNSDDLWNNLRSNDSHFSGGFDATISSEDAPKDDHALENLKDLSTGADLFQDFQSQTNYTETTENKIRNEDREIINDDKQKDSPAVTPAFDDWNSDDMWNNLQSSDSRYAGGFDATISSNDALKDDHALEYSKDLSAGADLFQDFQSQTNYMEMTENKTRNEDQEIINEDSFEKWNDFFTGSSSLQVPPQSAGIQSDYQVPISDQKSSEIDLLSLDNQFNEGNLGSFSQPNLSSEIDLLSLDNKFDEGKLGSFSQPNLFPTSTSDTDALTEANMIMPENHASSGDASSPSYESGQGANNGDAAGKSLDDDVKMLISQTHDLSFMLETNLSIPSGSEAPKSPPSPKD